MVERRWPMVNSLAMLGELYSTSTVSPWAGALPNGTVPAGPPAAPGPAPRLQLQVEVGAGRRQFGARDHDLRGQVPGQRLRIEAQGLGRAEAGESEIAQLPERGRSRPISCPGKACARACWKEFLERSMTILDPEPGPPTSMKEGWLLGKGLL